MRVSGELLQRALLELYNLPLADSTRHRHVPIEVQRNEARDAMVLAPNQGNVAATVLAPSEGSASP